MIYSEDLNGMNKEGRVALALIDVALASGFHVGARVAHYPSTSRYLTVVHEAGSITIRISDHDQVETAFRRFGLPDLWIDTRRMTVDYAVRRLTRLIERLERVEGSVPTSRLPSAFCGRLEAVLDELPIAA